MQTIRGSTRRRSDGTRDLRVGRRGQGPREFERIQQIAIGPEGILHVFDDQKHNRYSPSGEFFGTRRVPGLFRQVLALAILPDGALVLNENPLGGRIFHLVGPAGDPAESARSAASGEPRLSFGPRTDGYEFASNATRGRLAAAAATTFWAAPRNR